MEIDSKKLKMEDSSISKDVSSSVTLPLGEEVIPVTAAFVVSSGLPSDSEQLGR